MAESLSLLETAARFACESIRPLIAQSALPLLAACYEPPLCFCHDIIAVALSAHCALLLQQTGHEVDAPDSAAAQQRQMLLDEAVRYFERDGWGFVSARYYI